MKKTYINPEMEMVKIATHQMLAASPEISNTDATTDGNGDYDPSRRFGFDFDDEEEE